MDVLKAILKYNYWPGLIVILTIISCGRHSLIRIGNQYTDWIIQGSVILWIFLHYKKTYKNLESFDRKLILIYLIWIGLSFIRGMYLSQHYMDYKNCITGTFWCLPPLFILVSSSIKNVQKTLNIWIKCAISIWLLFMVYLVRFSELYFAPILFLVCFAPLLYRKRDKVILVVLTCLISFMEPDHRSWLFKGVISVLVFIAICLRNYISGIACRFICISVYTLTIALLCLGLSEKLNIFTVLNEQYHGQYEVHSTEFNRVEDLAADTRTFIYYEVIKSAKTNNYWLAGNTPAFGNNSEWLLERDERSSGIRHHNEIGFLNIFTWLGLIGLGLYIMFYFRASYLALTKSNNIYVKLLGCVVAVRWGYGWIEDVSQINMENYTLWLFIALCLSRSFRQLSNVEVKLWINKIVKI